MTLRRKKCVSGYLFPSRKGKKMNIYNHIREESAVLAMQHALRECVPLMTREWSKLFTGHALRVGGSNFMRKVGMHHEIHRKMGGWMTLAAAQGYMALTPAEQFSYTMSLVRSKKRLSALSEREARLALGAAVQPLSL